jgi:unsaturated chondroitin disaccharide hydrolase
MPVDNGVSPILAQGLEQAVAIIRRNIAVLGDERPRLGRADLTYERCGYVDWVAGFWCGQLWLAYGWSGLNEFHAAARRQMPYFAQFVHDTALHDHDLGFVYSLSAVADYKLTGNVEAREIGLAAARSLASRYNPTGRFIQAWNPHPDDTPANARWKRGLIIIDCMENLGLLHWAAAETGEQPFREIALAHARTAARYMVRPDGTSYHTFGFDPDSGQPLGGRTHQGYADESCWSRGQSWGIHGFALSYAYTGEKLLLDTACKLADYALAHLPPDYVPFWDYKLPPAAPQYRDSSAGAITAAGLLLLAEQCPDERREEYRQTGLAMLEKLTTEYTSAATPHAEGLLLHGAGFVKADVADNMLPYGDYFYLEGLLRANGYRNFFW